MKFFKYPKLVILLIVYILALFLAPFLDILVNALSNHLGIYTSIILGFLYSFSFTGGASSVMIYELHNTSFLFVFLSAIGSVAADYVIYKIFKLELKSEFRKLTSERAFKATFGKIRIFESPYIKFILGSIIIGSPFPDEIGVLLLVNSKMVSEKRLLLISFVSSFIGIYILSLLK